MSPELALQSDVFRIYLYIVAGFLIFGGAILIVLRFPLKRDVASAWKSFRGWLFMVPVFFASLFAGREVTIVFFALIAGFGLKEFSKATGLYRDWWYTGAIYGGAVSAAVLCLVRDPFTGRPGWFGMFMALPVYVIGVLLLIPIIRNIARGQLQWLALSIVGFIFIGWMFSHISFLANSRFAYGYLLFLVIAVQINDVAAFTFGKLFGKNPLRKEISPNKTWEGAVGALGVSMAVPWLFSFSFPHFGTLQLVLSGLIVGIGGQLGDLSISVIKRDLGIKDMGVLIPGHGGILDRVDSLIFTAPFFLHMVRFFYDLY